MRAMDQQHRKPKGSKSPARVVKRGSGKQGVMDVTSKTLRQAGSKLGNDQVQDLLAGSNAKRDALLRFVIERLQTIHDVQEKEVSALRNRDEWYRQVFLGKPGFHMPEPGRWADSAGYYKKAADALCDGRLGRAAQLLDRAVRAEEAAFESLPHQVVDKLDPGVAAATAAPEARENLSEEDTCGQRDRPAELKLADRILAVQPRLQRVSMIGRRPHDWWRGEDEEEEEDGDGAG